MERAKAFHEAIGWSAAMDIEGAAFHSGSGVPSAVCGRNSVS